MVQMASKNNYTCIICNTDYFNLVEDNLLSYLFVHQDNVVKIKMDVILLIINNHYVQNVLKDIRNQ